jgi:UDP-N-acetylglucosamine acyltransferase
MMRNIHPTAIVEKGARLAEDAEVEMYACIASDTEIHEGCRIGPHVVIHPWTTLGKGCTVHAGAVLGDTPQDLGFKGVRSYVKIGEHCTIREGVTIHRGTDEESTTRVGNHCYLMANSHAAHNVELADHVILANGVLLGGHVKVGERVFVGGGSGIHQFNRIGRLAMVGGNSSISADVPPFFMTQPGDYNTIMGLNSIGMRRAGLTPADRNDVKWAFDTLYRKGLTVKEAVAAIEEKFESGPAREMAQFISEAKRGICTLKR